MKTARIPETDHGIQGEPTVEVFDRFARNMRDQGWNNLKELLSCGITGGSALEIGPGPGYLGLEWLKQSPKSHVTGCEISPDMLHLAERNAAEYGFSNRAAYVLGSCLNMPFEDAIFDAVFSNGSLHEWEDPVKAFHEIHRVLKPGGRFFVSDMRRDPNPLLKWGIYLTTKPKEIRPGFLTSLQAAYTEAELKELLMQSPLHNARIVQGPFGLYFTGEKP